MNLNQRKISLLVILYLIIFSCSTTDDKQAKDKTSDYQWTELIDQNLSKWDNYLSFKHKVGYDGKPPRNDRGELIKPIGLNNLSYDVFTMIQEGDEHIIKVSGEYYGCLISKNEYENYHFQLKFKWGDKKSEPRENLLKDSGILYHSIGPPGAEYWRSWMLSQEFQIMEGHTGDYWSQATSAIDIRAYTPEYIMNPMADGLQEYLHIGEGGPYSNYCLRSSNHEYPHGEWNTLDLYCFDDKSLHIVNGEVVMILKNSRYKKEDGKFYPLTKGKIQLQSEAAEIYYKDIKIRGLDSLDQKLKAYF